MSAELSPSPRPRRLHRGDRWLLVAAVAASLPIVVATAQALADGWIAVGDNGYFLLRSRDVVTQHTPLLGTWTSSSTVLPFDVNNPGPMLFFLLAAPVKLGESAGLAVGVAILNIASVLGVAYALRRNAGALVAILGLLAATGLGWSMGGPLLFDPWQPHSLLHPFLLFIVLAWVGAAGDRWALPWAAAVASLLVQSHLSYVYVVPALGGVAVAGLVRGAVRTRRTDPDRWPDLRAGLWRVGIVTATVVVVCWLPALVEQATGPSRGNLTRLLEASREGAPTVGATVGLGRSAEVLSLWPTWLRPSFGDVERFGDLGDPVGLATSTVALGVLGAVLVATGSWAWRRRDRFAFVGVVVAAVAVVVGVFTATSVLETTLGVALHQLRYLWPIAIVAQLAMIVTVARGLGVDDRPIALAVATVAVVVLALANVPQASRLVGPTSEIAAAPAVRAMNDQLGELQEMGTILVRFDGRPFAEPFSGPFLAELGRRNIDFVVDEEVEVRQLGEHRAYEGHADAQVFLVWGAAALDDREDARRIAFASVLDEEELDIWVRVRGAILDAIDRGEVELTEEGRAAAVRGDFELTTDSGELDLGVLRFLATSRQVREAMAGGWIRVHGFPASDLDALREVESPSPMNTVSVWVADGQVRRS